MKRNLRTSRFRRKPFRLPNLGIALALVALLGAGGATLWWRLRPAPAPVEWKLRPLTADSGLTTTPALSADGKWLRTPRIGHPTVRISTFGFSL